MPALPHNVERVADNGGYRYRAYSKDGFCIQLRRVGRTWEGRALQTGRYVGSRRTLGLMGKQCASYTVQGPRTMAQALAARVAGLSGWNLTTDERNTIRGGVKNGSGTSYLFADGSRAFVPKGTAEVRIRG